MLCVYSIDHCNCIIVWMNIVNVYNILCVFDLWKGTGLRFSHIFRTVYNFEAMHFDRHIGKMQIILMLM